MNKQPARQVIARTIHDGGVIEETLADGSHRYTAAGSRPRLRETRASEPAPARVRSTARAELDARWDQLIDLVLGH